MKVRILWNREPTGLRFIAGYHPSHAPYMRVAADGEIAAATEEGEALEANEVEDGYVLDGLFSLFNQDDRPNAQEAPSMSVGDVVVLDFQGPHQRAYAVEMVGFKRIEWQDSFGTTGTMRGILIPVRGAITEVYVGGLEQLQATVGGPIELLPTPDPGIVALVNEEGKLQGQPMNERATVILQLDVIVGPVLFLGTDGEELRSLPPGFTIVEEGGPDVSLN